MYATFVNPIHLGWPPMFRFEWQSEHMNSSNAHDTATSTNPHENLVPDDIDLFSSWTLISFICSFFHELPIIDIHTLAMADKQ